MAHQSIECTLFESQHNLGHEIFFSSFEYIIHHHMKNWHLQISNEFRFLFILCFSNEINVSLRYLGVCLWFLWIFFGVPILCVCVTSTRNFNKNEPRNQSISVVREWEKKKEINFTQLSKRRAEAEEVCIWRCRSVALSIYTYIKSVRQCKCFIFRLVIDRVWQLVGCLCECFYACCCVSAFICH